jgi:hypothetical protein
LIDVGPVHPDRLYLTAAGGEQRSRLMEGKHAFLAPLRVGPIAHQRNSPTGGVRFAGHDRPLARRALQINFPVHDFIPAI